jgi:hypothetical protein
MPGLVGKILIFAAKDGLILQPQPTRRQPVVAQPIKINYSGSLISPWLTFGEDEEGLKDKSLESHGIVGNF